MKSKLPPGQHEIPFLPRFGVPAFAGRLPQGDLETKLTLGGEFFPSFTVSQQELAGLPRRDLHADFHCVTTWTKRDLDWSGWAVRDLYDTFMAPRVSTGAAGTHLEVVALDGYSTSVILEDALAANVIVADRLQGEPISREHGAPLRLVAPDLYAFKSVKHLCEINLRSEFRPGLADRQTRAHRRGRVALEERGRGLPGWLYRWIYRATIRPALWIYRRADRKRG
jgi:DMSO/TMAO reductase YedYZ molybdopterin-dependent catalytic subunit